MKHPKWDPGMVEHLFPLLCKAGSAASYSQAMDNRQRVPFLANRDYAARLLQLRERAVRERGETYAPFLDQSFSKGGWNDRSGALKTQSVRDRDPNR
jgi:hypothetical protein